MTRHWRVPLAVLVSASLLAAACSGDDDDDDAADLLSTDASLDLSTDTSEPVVSDTVGGGVSDAVLSDLDADGDGVLTLGVATPGPRDDGAYYQALVENVESYAAAEAWPTPLIFDNIATEEAEAKMRELAELGPDVIFVGANQIAEPLEPLAEEFNDIFWYCRCGTGWPESEWFAQSSDDSSEISFTAGYATALLLADRVAADPEAGTRTAFIGNNSFAFEQEALAAFQIGLDVAATDLGLAAPYVVDYYASGSFDDYEPNAEDPSIVGAKAAYDQALDEGGVGAVYPYLGGAHVPIVADGNADGLIVMSAGSSTACEDPPVDERTDEPVRYDLEVRFDGGDYLQVIMQELFTGELLEGDVRRFLVGDQEEIVNEAGETELVYLNGAVICEPTGDQEARMQAINDRIAAGEFIEEFDAVKEAAYSGG